MYQWKTFSSFTFQGDVCLDQSHPYSLSIDCDFRVIPGDFAGPGLLNHEICNNEDPEILSDAARMISADLSLDLVEELLGTFALLSSKKCKALKKIIFKFLCFFIDMGFYVTNIATLFDVEVRALRYQLKKHGITCKKARQMTEDELDDRVAMILGQYPNAGKNKLYFGIMRSVEF